MATVRRGVSWARPCGDLLDLPLIEMSLRPLGRCRTNYLNGVCTWLLCPGTERRLLTSSRKERVVAASAERCHMPHAGIRGGVAAPGLSKKRPRPTGDLVRPLPLLGWFQSLHVSMAAPWSCPATAISALPSVAATMLALASALISPYCPLSSLQAVPL